VLRKRSSADRFFCLLRNAVFRKKKKDRCFPRISNSTSADSCDIVGTKFAVDHIYCIYEHIFQQFFCILLRIWELLTYFDVRYLPVTAFWGFQNRIGASEPFLSQRFGARFRRKKEPGGYERINGSTGPSIIQGFGVQLFLLCNADAFPRFPISTDHFRSRAFGLNIKAKCSDHDSESDGIHACIFYLFLF
jgi:hypothetical protein